MVYIIFAGILFIIFRIIKENRKKDFYAHINNTSSIESSYIDPLEGIPFSKGNYKINFPIKGINLNQANLSDIGLFDGYVEALDDNPYDKHAVAIYSSLGKKYGYLPRDNKKVHEYIKLFGGKLRVEGEIEDGGGYLFGSIDIWFDSSIISKSNLYENINNY